MPSKGGTGLVAASAAKPRAGQGDGRRQPGHAAGRRAGSASAERLGNS